MTNVVNSGYLAAAQTALSTEMNSLADNTWSALSPEIDNSTTKYMFADMEVQLGSAVFTGADAAIEIYLVPSLDDTNYPNYTATGTADEQENNQYFIGAVALSPDTEAQLHVLRGVQLPPSKFKLGIRSRANVSTAGSGNSLKWRPWGYASQ